MNSIDNNIDPRLLYAQPGQWISPGLSGTLQPTEDQYYRRQHQDFEERCARARANKAWRQQFHTAAYSSSHPGHQVTHLHNESGWDSQHHEGAGHCRPSQMQQQQILSYAQHHIQPQTHPAHITKYHGLPHLNTSVQHTRSIPGLTAQADQPFHQPVQHSHIQPKHALAPLQAKRNANFNTLTNTPKAASCLPTLTKPAGITKSVDSTTPNWNDSENQHIDYLAFCKLKKEQKVQILFELMTKDDTSVAPAKSFPSPATSGTSLHPPTTNTSQSARKGMVTPPSSPAQPPPQVVSVVAPSYQPSPYANQGFANHPNFSNIVSKFTVPQYHGLPIVPAQQKENVGPGLPFSDDAKKKWVRLGKGEEPCL
jgi:hypothetical protein